VGREPLNSIPHSITHKEVRKSDFLFLVKG